MRKKILGQFLLLLTFIFFQVNSIIGCSCKGYDNPYSIDESNLTKFGRIYSTKQIISIKEK